MKGAEDKGIAKGEAKKGREIARKLKALGVDYKVISAATGLSATDIDNLAAN